MFYVKSNWEDTMKSTKDSLLEDIKAEFAEVNAMMEALEAKEPEDEASEAYDKWIEDCRILRAAALLAVHRLRFMV